MNLFNLIKRSAYNEEKKLEDEKYVSQMENVLIQVSEKQTICVYNQIPEFVKIDHLM
jgi:hypothetical protein